MAACNFSIPFSGPVETVISKARTAVQSQGGNFTGDSTGGSFDVSVFGNTIKGTFTPRGQVLEIAILAKPFLIPCSTIEGFLKGQLT